MAENANNRSGRGESGGAWQARAISRDKPPQGCHAPRLAFSASLPVSREKAGVCAFQVGAPLAGEELAVNAEVTNQHCETLPERFTDNLPVFNVNVIRKTDTIGQSPSVTLAGDGAQLVGDGEPLLVRGDDGAKEFARELVPEVVEEVLRRAADAAVVVGRAEDNHIGPMHPGLELGVTGQVVSGVRVVEGERLLLQVQYIHRATRGLKFLRDVAHDHTRDRISLQAADDSQDV